MKSSYVHELSFYNDMYLLAIDMMVGVIVGSYMYVHHEEIASFINYCLQVDLFLLRPYCRVLTDCYLISTTASILWKPLSGG